MGDIKKAVFALFAVAIAIGTTWQASRIAVPKPATWDEVAAEAGAGGYHLITTEELAARYGENQSNLLLIDTRQEWEYRSGHIRGALNFPMEPTRWSRWRKAGDLERFLGTDKDRAMVFY